MFCTVSEYNFVATKKIAKKLPDVRHTWKKTACPHLYLYRNGKRKKSGHKKKQHPVFLNPLPKTVTDFSKPQKRTKKGEKNYEKGHASLDLNVMRKFNSF